MKRWLRFLSVAGKSRGKKKELDHEQILTNCIQTRMSICQLLVDHAKVSGDQEECDRYKTMLNNAKKDFRMIPITVTRWKFERFGVV